MPMRSRAYMIWLCTATVIWTGCTGGGDQTQRQRLDGPSRTLSDTARVYFSDVTAAAELDQFRHETGTSGEKWMPETMGAGGGFIDYNGDDWLDIVLVSGDVWPQHSDARIPALRLYQNEGDGTFREVTRQTGLWDHSAYGMGVTAADYDNDGDQDLFLSTLSENKLFRNDGGIFQDVSVAAGVADRNEWSTSALFFDADNDGNVDLYVGNYVDWSPEEDVWCSLDGEDKAYCTPEVYEGTAGRYYHNNGDGTFEDQSKQAGFLPSPGKTLGVAELDFNRDGWSDLVVANDTERNLLYENDGDGTFTEKGRRSGIAFGEDGAARAGMGVDAGVIDPQGTVAVMVGNLSQEMIGVFEYVGNGLFLDRAAVSRIGQPSLHSLTFGLLLSDVDLDSDLDLFAANGHLQERIGRVQDVITYRQNAQLFINRGDGQFREVAPTTADALSRKLVARGAAYGDYDRDGDVDILITENGGPVHLWRNETANGRYLRVDLRGRQSNRDGLGARVVVHVDSSQIERRVRTGSSYLSVSEKTITFGLGRRDSIDSLAVYWPGNRVDRFHDVNVNQTVRITEGEQEPAVISGR